ncbi:MAG: hypothetical protein JSW11_07530 [Candidatus Heimdallarchaeota archaeon]|nr:MAG: hypothetical protein JSW11_07530 [Candidatus Heimdallarchaeota archaeon]
MKIMKKTLKISLFIVVFSLISLTVLTVVGEVADDQVGFVSPKIKGGIDLNDGEITSFWTNITDYQNVTEFGEHGYVKFANNETHLYTLIVSSTENVWISIEFEPDPSLCMKNLNDGWSFYIDEEEETVLAKDIMFIGTVIPEDDVKNDLQIESVFSEGLVYIEVVRSFDTSDPDGFDIAFENGSTNLLQFASKKKHFGDHNKYYLYVLVSDKTEGNPIIPDIPEIVDLNQVKFLLLGVTPVGVFGFIGIHMIRRVLYSPIKHDHDRIVSSSWKPPTLVERFKDTFLSKE